MGCLFLFRSVTTAQRAERVLAQNGMIGYIVRPPVSLQRGSCGFGVKTRSDCRRALAVLRAASLPIESVWRQQADGYTEVQL